MNKLTTKFSLTLLASLVLIGCGGGGSGGSSASNTQPTPINETPVVQETQPAQNVANTENSTTTQTEGTPSQTTENAVADNSTDVPPAETKPENTTANNPESMPSQPVQNTVADNSTALPPVETKPKVEPQPKSLDSVPDDLKESVSKEKELKLVKTENGEFIRTIYVADRPLGVINEKLESGQIIRGINQVYSSSSAFYDGGRFSRFIDQTATSHNILRLSTKPENMPTTGIAHYEGKSVGSNSEGTFNLTADFKEKTVEGKLSNRNISVRDLTLEKTAFRTENDEVFFSGRVTSLFDNDYYYGVFAGPNAEEVVGAIGKKPKDIDINDLKVNNLEIYQTFGGTRKE